MTKLDHKLLWAAIDRLAEQKGLTTSGLAVKAGLDPTSFNKSKRIQNGRKHWPSTESLVKVMRITDVSLETFLDVKRK